MANNENLKPFPPGVSGNPKGRPRGLSLSKRLRDLLDDTAIGGKALPNGRQVADLVTEGLIKGAAKGNPGCLKILLERVDGPVPLKVELTGEDGGPVEIDATVRHQAAAELDAWRKEMTERLSSTRSAPPTPPTSSTPSA